MSIYSRDYMKGPQRSGIPSPVNWSVVTWLLVVNITVFIIHHGFYNAPPTWASVLGLSIEGLTRWWLWTPVTYQFLHGHLFHLLGNMLVLFFLGRMLQREIPQRHVLRLYLLGGLVGGFFQLVWNLSLQRDAACVGASASVLAIAFALVTLRPNERLRLMLFFLIPVNLTFRTLGIILIVVNVFELIRGIAYPISSSAQIAVLAHFGGMFFGWFYMKQFTPQWDIGNAREGKKSFWDRFRIRILDDSEKSPVARKPKKQKRKKSGKQKPFVSDNVDAILDKINEHGFQSLTDDEKKTLERSSEKLAKRKRDQGH